MDCKLFILFISWKWYKFPVRKLFGDSEWSGFINSLLHCHCFYKSVVYAEVLKLIFCSDTVLKKYCGQEESARDGFREHAWKKDYVKV